MPAISPPERQSHVGAVVVVVVAGVVAGGMRVVVVWRAERRGVGAWWRGHRVSWSPVPYFVG